MRDCWEFHPAGRPKFEAILQRLGDQLQSTAVRFKFISAKSQRFCSVEFFFSKFWHEKKVFTLSLQDYLALGSQSNIFMVNNQEYMETAQWREL